VRREELMGQVAEDKLWGGGLKERASAVVRWGEWER
jgi:hypothetical protein